MGPSIELLSEAHKRYQSTRQVPKWLADIQDLSWQQFESQGLPWRKDEHWKYTSLYGLAKIPFVAAVSSDPAVSAAGTKVNYIYADDAAIRVTLRNGLIDSTASTAFPDSVQINRLHQLDNNTPNELDPPVARPSPMLDLNHAFADHQVEITISDNTILEKPIYLVHQTVGAAVLSSPRVTIRIGKNSQAQVIEHYVGEGEGHTTNSRLSLSLGNNATLNHVKVQMDGSLGSHFANTDVKVATDASYVSWVIDLGAQLARSDLGIELNGTGAQCTMNGVFLPASGQHMDHHTFVKHAVAHTNSTQTYRGVAGYKGHGVFNGKVLVQPDAQKINAVQSNDNLLLADNAEIDTKPELEIYADDVKCAHGATVGQLDETSLFYLTSRGIDQHIARQLLISGFVRTAYAGITCPTLSQYIDNAVTDKLTAMIEQLS